MAKKQKSNQTKIINEQLKQKNAHIDEHGIFVFSEPLSIADFAKALNKSVVDIIKYFMKQGKLYNQNQLLTEELMAEACLEFGYDFKKTKNITYENILENIEFNDKIENLIERPPVVTIMGHVDHGKTTLLDTIRNSKITNKEHGGITQHIGAYQVKINNKLITFIDTPGHEAFTEMRVRGSKITDVVILVVAADDGVMPQTKEAIDHAKAAGVEILVFVNKMDKPTINTERIMNELSSLGLTSEEWGGDTIFVYGSALKNQGIDNLLESILVVAELKDLRANPNRIANGTVIESHSEKNIGNICTLLVQGGTLNVQDIVVAGSVKGKIKKMTNDLGKDVKKAGPSAVVQIFGFEGAPKPGEAFVVFNDEKTAKKIALAKQAQETLTEQAQKIKISLDNIAQEASSGKLKQINIILKADTQGSLQAITQALSKINVQDIQVKLVRASVGGISESDIKLALASKSMIYGFNIRPNAIVREAAKAAGTEIRLHNVIYKLTEELEKAAKGLLEPEYEEKVLGQARVMKTFHFSKVGTIAGCLVIEGNITRNNKVHILRDDIVIYNGEIAGLRHEKNDLKSAKKGLECGITIKNYNDLKENDIIESYSVEIVPVK